MQNTLLLYLWKLLCVYLKMLCLIFHLHCREPSSQLWYFLTEFEQKRTSQFICYSFLSYRHWTSDTCHWKPCVSKGYLHRFYRSCILQIISHSMHQQNDPNQTCTNLRNKYIFIPVFCLQCSIFLDDQTLRCTPQLARWLKFSIQFVAVVFLHTFSNFSENLSPSVYWQFLHHCVTVMHTLWRAGF